MLQYQPPKSSVWGHSLRKMPAVQARDLFAQFLKVAVHDYTWSAWRMRGEFETLTENGFATALEIIIDSESSGNRFQWVLAQVFEISNWQIGGEIRPTHSTFTMYYGADPSIGTRLQFESIDQFHYIKQVLADLRLCKLNDKHLKPRK